MKEVIRSADPRVAALIARQATQSKDRDQIGLERITALLDSLGRPQDALPPVFHVAGTNGKGSTVAFLRAALEAAGHRVHVFTSPHLVRYNERIRLAGRLIDDERLARLMGTVLDANEAIGASLFEVNTAAAFLAFGEVAADAAILEVGLGGRLDATNVIEAPLVTGIASIGLDHQQFLGDTIGAVAVEKAGIAKPGVPLVALANLPEAEAAFARVAAEVGAPLRLEGRDWAIDPSLKPALPGAHQVRNANLARQMLDAQDRFAVGEASFAAALTATDWPARFQRLADGPLGAVETWLDGAHNEDAACALAALLADVGPMHLVLGVLANKDAGAIVGALKPHALSLSFVPVPDHEHHDPDALAARFGGRAAASVEEALAPLPAPRLVAGSLYLAGRVLSLNRQLPD
ncbi:bifunctional folylpolyglutamate synthase/dihydrofolate synthase [Sphingomonas sp. ASV193]|uniref:bifunctional folylpolyglutamate synthase/dihydrofolate synthase n=1 Tax=Sphingomonas sp. ASV193 TaxID=3144405 RepID=UPI0032E8FF9B